MRLILKTLNLTVMFLIFLYLPQVNAIDLHVDAEFGNDQNDGLTWETAYRSISAALGSASQYEDRIHVATGTYPEEVSLISGIDLTGGYPAGGGVPDPGVNETIIDGENLHRCVLGAEDAHLEGFTLLNGFGRNGGAILHNDISMVVKQCIIKNCIATGGTPYGGGAMYFFLSSSVIKNCIFENNSVQIDPESDAGEAMGGAVMIWASSPTFQNCTFLRNQVLENETADLRLGGAIWASASAPIIQGCLFQENAAVTAGAIGWWNRTTPLIEGCQFIGNIATGLGGGICHIYNESAVAETDLWIRDCRFQGNTANLGGGILISRNNRVVVSNCVFHENYALDSGSAIAIDSSRCRIDHCTVANNIASVSGETGGAIYIDSTATVTISNSIIADNPGIYGIELEPGGDPMIQSVDHVNVFGHTVNYSRNIVDRTGSNGNISQDPLFVPSMPLDFCLSEPATGDAAQASAGISPCIDAGNHPSVGYSQNTTSTRTDLVSDTGQADMGWHRRNSDFSLVSEMPYAGEFAVSMDTTITCRLINVPVTVSLEDVSIFLDGIPVACEMETTDRGIAMKIVPAKALLINHDYWIEVAIDQGTKNLSFEYFFSTAPWPNQPRLPQGTTLELSFPMTQSRYSADDELSIQLELYNPWLNNLTGDIYIGFEYAGLFYFYPAWDAEAHWSTEILGPGSSQSTQVLEFIVPDDIPDCGPITFYALALEPNSMNIMSNLAIWELFFTQ